MRAVAFVIGGLLTLGFAVLIPRLSHPPERFTVGLHLIDQGRADEAATLFVDPVWKGVAEYRAGRFQRAAMAFSSGDTALAYYNMGNAHARLHEWGNAKAAYRKGLHLDPSHADALYSLDLVEQAEKLEEQQLADAAAATEEGGWQDVQGNEEEAAAAFEEGLRVEEKPDDKTGSEDADYDAAQEATNKSGESDLPGLAGDEALSDEAQRGVSADPASDEADAEFSSLADTAAIRRESEQAAEILLRQIHDDPERVLAARLRSAHRLRRALEGSCTDC